jgi:hypothetical protein
VTIRRVARSCLDWFVIGVFGVGYITGPVLVATGYGVQAVGFPTVGLVLMVAGAGVIILYVISVGAWP